MQSAVYNMDAFSSCSQAIEACLKTKTFSIVRQRKEDKTLDMHIHDCYEMYFAISGDLQFLISNRIYPIHAGDLFVINPYESHKLICPAGSNPERIVINLHPEYVRSLSSEKTKLDHCFLVRDTGFEHRLFLNPDRQRWFLATVDKLLSPEGYGQDLYEKAAMLELLVTVNQLYQSQCTDLRFPTTARDRLMNDILEFINRNITDAVSIQTLSERFFVSPSYLCRLFKQHMGTTIGKYVIAQRIALAKSFLESGTSVSEAYERSGFTDYSSFYKAFKRAVGISPKKYAGHL